MTEEEQDELVSAYLDDEVTDDERARVEGDPAFRERVAAMRAVTAHLTARVEAPIERDRWIAAATKALPAPVAARRPRWLAPAGAVAACFAVVIGLSRVTIGSDDDFATTALNTSEAAGAAATTSAASQAKSDAARAPANPALSTTTRPGFVGDFPTDAELLTTLRTGGRASAASGPQTLEARPVCAADGATLSARVAEREVLIAISASTVTLTDAVTCERRLLSL